MTVANGKFFRKVFFNSYFVEKLPLNLFVSKVKFLPSKYFTNCYGIMRKGVKNSVVLYFPIKAPPSEQRPLRCQNIPYFLVILIKIEQLYTLLFNICLSSQQVKASGDHVP